MGTTSAYTTYHDYIFAHGIYARTLSGTTTVHVRDSDELNTLNTLASGGVSISTISNNVGATELILLSRSTQVAVGSSNSGYLLLA